VKGQRYLVRRTRFGAAERDGGARGVARARKRLERAFVSNGVERWRARGRGRGRGRAEANEGR